MTTFTLTTERLRLREMRQTDFDDVYRMNSDPDVMKYVGDGATRTHAQMVLEMEMLISHYLRKPGLGIWAVELKDTAQFVGACGLVYYDNTPEIEIGYRMLKEHWNQGFATEAGFAVLAYGFNILKLPKIVSSAHLDNGPSRRVMEKLGMSYIDNRFQYGCMQAYYELPQGVYLTQQASNVPGQGRV